MKHLVLILLTIGAQILADEPNPFQAPVSSTSIDQESLVQGLSDPAVFRSPALLESLVFSLVPSILNGTAMTFIADGYHGIGAALLTFGGFAAFFGVEAGRNWFRQHRVRKALRGLESQAQAFDIDLSIGLASELRNLLSYEQYVLGLPQDSKLMEAACKKNLEQVGGE